METESTNSQSLRSVDRSPLDPDAETMRRLGYDVVDRIVNHLTTLTDQRVARRGSSQDFAALVDEPVPFQGVGIEDCVEFFFDRVVPLMTRVNHPRFHAYIPCPSSYAGIVGMMLAAGTNPFVGSWLGGATVASLELTTLRWIRELLQLNPHSEGVFTSGGSLANLTGIAAARAKFGRHVLDHGVIYVSTQGHGSIEKSALVLGFAPDNIRAVATDSNFRIESSALLQTIVADRKRGLVPFLLAANAGTTNTGAIDDLNQLADLCVAEDIWFHIDAAYGGFAALVPEVRQQMAGMERADSLTLDPHKWLYCPMGIGCTFVREPEFLQTAFSTEGHYLKDLSREEVNFFDRGPELSRPARVLPVWILLRSVGREALVHQIRTDIELAHLAADLLKQDVRFDVQPVQLSIVTFRHRLQPGETEAQRSARDDALMEATLQDGQLMVSTTTLNGINTLRLVVMNPRTTKVDIRRSVSRIQQLAE